MALNRGVSADIGTALDGSAKRLRRGRTAWCPDRLDVSAQVPAQHHRAAGSHGRDPGMISVARANPAAPSAGTRHTGAAQAKVAAATA